MAQPADTSSANSSSGKGSVGPTMNRLSVKTGEIEKGLEKLRTSGPSSGEAAGNQSPQPRMRAVLANLIVLVRENGAFGNESNLETFISRLAVAHPSRFFIIRIKESGEQPIESEVVSRLIVPDSGARLHSEEIYLDVTPQGAPFVANLLLSLFIADVDVVMVLPEPLGNGETAVGLLRDLRKLSRLVLVDSSTFQNYAPDLGHLIQECAPDLHTERDDYLPQMKKFSDINWRRTRRWRSLLAECFDSELLVTHQTIVSRVKFFVCNEVEEVQKGKLPADALLMAGWCVACLNWKLEHLRCSKTHRGLMVNVHQSEDSNSPAIAQLEFISWKQNTLSEKTVAAERDPAFGLAGVEIVLDPDKEALRLKIVRLFERNAAEIILGATSPEKSSGTCEFSVRYAPFYSEGVEELVFKDILSNRGEDVSHLSLENAVSIADSVNKYSQS